jgi:sterol desaturase/sphingolipid hydroxylase (fatty acid hydroxylase superfamily)
MTLKRLQIHVNPHRLVDGAVIPALVAIGMCHPRDPLLWLNSFVTSFLVIIIGILTSAALFYVLTSRIGDRIQSEKRPLICLELDVLIKSMLVAATFAAWPVTQYRLGEPTGLVWDLEEIGVGSGTMLLQSLGGVVVLDAYLYWKHRLLHTRMLFPFHQDHHRFHDPTPFAALAVGPLESVLTYWPSLLLCWPAAIHWGPFYVTINLFFIVLNFYLHSGVTFPLLENVLLCLGFNSSAHHNTHHSHRVVNFGEPMILWDILCNTRLKKKEILVD